ncbi:hypothetical protein Glove_55g45 [Diversispora epigaea]|uniref:Protein kinase domain-containing protein n=1 Tax=Diversispora epigaea TaxID=1348612 RepID=A0A397JMB4_9GLOM|nr:hypothetical protein Glove_55g45 [Diversispora epigaea]
MMLEEIEKDLFRVKRLRHANLITIYESELGRSETGWNLYILMEYARGGTLEDLLKKCETKPYSRKNDIWCLGVIFVQMLFGLNVIKQYNSLEDLLKSEKDRKESKK